MSTLFSVRCLTKNAVIAALYIAITYALSFASYGNIQFRFSEVMVFLAFIDPFYIPGLTIGCFFANLFGPFGLIDAIFGSVATLYSVVMIALTPRILKKLKLNLPLFMQLFIASLWPVSSSLLLGFEIAYASSFAESFLLWSLSIAIGEFVVISVIGVPVFAYVLKKFPNFSEKLL